MFSRRGADGAARVEALTPKMTDVAKSADGGLINAWLMRLAPIAEATVILSVWLLNRYYEGIVNDNRIYIGRVLADLDPHGLGREPAFIYDEQTKHTIFSHLLTPLVAAFGPSATSMGVTLVILLIWLAAATWLAHKLMPRRMVPAALICAAVLPAFYGPLDIFAFGQALVTPRGFAEAGVLAALAALLSGRRLLCAALLTLAAAFHPIMVAPGFGVMFLFLAQKDWRWWGLVPLGLIGLLAAGALHLGPAKTLLTVFDPDWRYVIHRYKGFLFVANWPAATWRHTALPVTTLAIAAMVLRGRCRVLVIAALIVAAAGLAASFLLGDLLGSVLIIQLQLWRGLWIVQVLAVLLVPVLAVELWTLQRRDARLSVVLMGLSWIQLNETLGIFPIMAAGLGLAAAARWRQTDLAPAKALTVASIGALVYILGGAGKALYNVLLTIQMYTNLRFGLPPLFFERTRIHVLPIFAIALALLLFPRLVTPRVGRIAIVLTAVLLIQLTALAWDERTPTRRITDLGQGRADLNRLIGPETGAGVVWMPDDNAPWFLLSRATWVSDLQGAIGTFSRPLIMQWQARTMELVKSGLGTIPNTDPHAWQALAQAGDDAHSRDGALRVCGLKNGPQAIVLAGDLTKMFGPGVAARWRAPVRGVWQASDIKPPKLITFDYYTIVRCNRVAPLAQTNSAPRLKA
jgi:hypothetical protein